MYSNLASDHIDAGEPKKGIELLAQAMRIDPRNVSEIILSNMASAQFMLGDNDAAIEWSLKALDRNPGWIDAQATLAMAYARNGDRARSRAAVATLLQTDPKFSLSKILLMGNLQAHPPAFREYWETKLLPAWRLAGLPE